jgi:putative selenium metabolism protein SsnA
MTIFEGVKVVSFEPPAVSEPMDVVVAGPGNGTCTGAIVETGKGLAAKYPRARRASGSYLSPGLVCSHTHLYSALARGLMTPIAPSKDFAQQLRNLWWRLDRAIDLPILEASALAGCAEAAACGVTSVIDHHAGPEAIDGSLSVIRGAFEEVGLRGLVCYETTDRNGAEGARDGVRENLRFAREIDSDIASASREGDAGKAAARRPIVDGMIGAHAGFTIGEETLAALGEAVRSSGRGFHVHAAEDRYDAVDSRHRFGKDLAERLDGAGCLGAKSIVAHGLWLTESESEILNARGSFLAHNARSNMNNSVGYASLLPRYANVVLGTDGMSADMLEELRFAAFRHREAAGPWWPDDFLRCLDRGNRILERYMGVALGRVVAGARADLVLWDYDPPTPLVGGNVAGHMAFGMSSRSVRSVMVEGKFVIADRAPAFDAAAIAAKARVQARRLWDRIEERK